MIKADKLKPLDVYKPGEDSRDQRAVAQRHRGWQGAHRAQRPDGVHVYMTAIRSHFTPDVVRVKEGETVHVHLTNLEQAYDATHGFAINSYNVNVSIEPGEASDITFVADRAGVFPMYCTEFCSALHLEMAGYLPTSTEQVQELNTDTQADHRQRGGQYHHRACNFKDFPDGGGPRRGRDGPAEVRWPKRRSQEQRTSPGKADWPNATLWARPVVAVPGQGRGHRTARQDLS
jgi:nitrous-oxide reductase